jgi:DNA-binding MarR family transcriptional regulator
MSKQISEDIFESIAGLNHQIRTRHKQVIRHSGYPLVGMEFKALMYIARTPGATQKDLVQRSGRDKAQIARIMAGLKNQGLIEATPDENDRRSSRLSLTAEGEKLYGVFRELNREIATEAVTGLSAAECRTLLALLDRMNGNLRQERENL